MPPTTLPALLSVLADRFGSRPALLGPRGRRTYADLARSTGDIARALVARGVGKGTRVGVLLPNWPEWVATAFGVWQCGGVLVPLNTLSRPRELAHALRHADVSLLVAVRRFLRHDYEAALAEIAPGLAGARLFHAGLPALRETVWLDPPPPGVPVELGPLLDRLPEVPVGWPERLAAAVAPTDWATIFFTSGTTAEPKGVVHTHHALCHAADDIATVLGLDAADRTWGYLPFFFTGGLIAVALATLGRGGGVVVQEVFEPGETLQLLAEERCTVFFAWPHQAEALRAHPAFPTTPLALRKGVGANTTWAANLYPPDHSAVGTYGMTETGPLCTAWPWHAPLALRATSHGPPVGDKAVRIVDPETGVEVPRGCEGEICVRGATLFSHYYKQRRGACVDGAGFFRTGDLGRLDERGALHFLGRLKDVIKAAGVNVAAAEVEACLAAHPDVAAAHVVGVPDAMRGEHVGAFVVPKGAVAIDDLIAHCRARLATYKVPRHLWLRRQDELPQKGSGKVDKLRLRAEAIVLVRDGGDRSGSPPAGPG